MDEKKSAANAIADIVKLGSRFSAREMDSLATAAGNAGGSLVAVDVDGDWCPTGRIRFKWPPPRKNEFGDLIDRLVKDRIHFNVLIHGIPWPDEVFLNISRGPQLGR